MRLKTYSIIAVGALLAVACYLWLGPSHMILALLDAGPIVTVQALMVVFFYAALTVTVALVIRLLWRFGSKRW